MRFLRWVKQDGLYRFTFTHRKLSDLTLYVEADIKMSEVFKNLVDALCIAVGNRDNYENNIQDFIRLVASENSGEYQSKAIDKFISVIKEELKENKDSILLSSVTLNAVMLTNICKGIIDKAVLESGIETEAYRNALKQISFNVLPIFVRFVLADAKISGGSNIVAFIDNFDIVFNPHLSEQCIAWLMALDENYASDTFYNKYNNVKVEVNKVTETKKILFVKSSIVKYEVNIIPDFSVPVTKIEYRLLPVGSYKSGTSFTSLIQVDYLQIIITDAYGYESEWLYRNGQVIPVED